MGTVGVTETDLPDAALRTVADVPQVGCDPSDDESFVGELHAGHGGMQLHPHSDLVGAMLDLMRGGRVARTLAALLQ
jgi:hypothetical protein